MKHIVVTFVLVMVVSIGGGLLTSACHPKQCETNPGSAECKAAAVLDCTVGTLGSAVTQLVPIVEGYIESNTKDGTTDWSKINLGSLAAQEGTCVLTQLLLKRAAVVSEHPTTARPLDDLQRQLELHMKRNHVDPKTTVHTTLGDR